MKAICLAALAILVYTLVVTVGARSYKTDRRALVMTMTFACSLMALAVLWYATPADLGFLPAQLLAEPPWLDGAATLFFFSSAFFGGVLQLYNLADRGFSLRILIDTLESDAGTTDIDDILTGYSRGRGMAWMYHKRLDGMLQGGFVRAEQDSILLTPKGARKAAIFAALRRFSRLELAE